MIYPSLQDERLKKGKDNNSFLFSDSTYSPVLGQKYQVIFVLELNLLCCLAKQKFEITCSYCQFVLFTIRTPLETHVYSVKVQLKLLL